MEEKFYVYILLNNLKPGRYQYPGLDRSFLYEPFYVGKGTGKRVFDHFKNIKKRSYKNNIINKIKNKLNVDPYHLLYKENILETEAFRLEIELIKNIGKYKDTKGPLTNITDGGSGGLTVSIESIPKVSKRFKSLWQNPQKRKQMLDSREITYQTEEYKIRASNASRGELNNNCKLSNKKIENIIKLLSLGWLPAHICKLYNIPPRYIDELKRGQARKYLSQESLDLLEKAKVFFRVKFTLNPKQIISVIGLHKEGLSYNEIVKKLGVKYSVVARLIRDWDKIPYVKLLKECKLL